MIRVECDICTAIFDDLDDFDEHWKKAHAVNYGPRSYCKITYWKDNEKEG